MSKKTGAAINSLPVGVPGVIFLSVKDDRTIQDTVNIDELQKKISLEINKAYPRIKYYYKIIRINSAQVLAVIAWGSENRPHFAGPSYIRDGSETRIASDAEFIELIDKRSSKVAEILKWKNKYISFYRNIPTLNKEDMIVEDCNQFYITLKSSSDRFISFPLQDLTITFDQVKNRLMLRLDMRGYRRENISWP